MDRPSFASGMKAWGVQAEMASKSCIVVAMRWSSLAFAAAANVDWSGMGDSLTVGFM